MQDNRALLMERYPEIGFLFTYSTFEPYTLFEDREGKLNAKRNGEVLHGEEVEEMVEWKRSLHLEEIDILYIFGVGLGYAYDVLKEWLRGKRGRVLVFLEEDLAVIDALVQREEAGELLADEQVYLNLITDRKRWNDAVEMFAQTFVSDKILCAILPAYKKAHGKRYKRIELKLMRATASLHALLSESLHGQKIFANLYPNFKRLHQAFYANKLEGKFSKVPAVICGAGPSLKGAIPYLKELEDRALILAGGSTLTALSRHGIEPHLGMALDPNPEEYERLRPSTAFETPLLYANRVLPDIFTTCNGLLGYMRSDTGGIAETWIEEKLGIEGDAIGPDLGREAFSVTTMAVAFAYLLGCDPIILVGVDLAYTGMQRYAEGVLDSANDISLASVRKEIRLTERLLKRKDREGKPVATLLKWVMESSSIGAYAKAHSERTFINATEGGIGFPYIPYMPLKEAIQQHCILEHNLRGRVFASIQNAPFEGISQNDVTELLADLKSSLMRTLQLCEELLQETSGRRAVLEMDIAEEPAYQCFLYALGPALDRLLFRYFPREEHEKIKWTETRSILLQYLQLFL
jgi:hypothetical protein